MSNSAANIHCSNPNCQAPNPLNSKFCHKCRTPIIKRYLWALGATDQLWQFGELLGERYLVSGEQILLDTKPTQTPQLTENLPKSISNYLKLYAYRLHIPQVYGYLAIGDKFIWLLEFDSVPTDEAGNLQYPSLLPSISQMWQSASGLRQLNWLWQIANLWQPLQNQGVASSLLNPSLLRINGALVQLLELELDLDSQPSLSQLGQLWQQWVQQADPSIQDFLAKLCQSLSEKQITEVAALISVLDESLKRCGQNWTRQYQIYSLTDSGPTRKHNEDACYPNPGKLVNVSGQEKVLAIVCDGIGGHEGGEIASGLAINFLKEAITDFSFDEHNSHPDEISLELEKFICTANDLISDRNDTEKRQERQRMGTTLVMSLAYAHEMYLSHVGDSRIYWISTSGCHQVTVDDDLASREVRLGYALYRDASQYPSAGALVQALGMGSSTLLHPTVQRIILDEDCIFLLCSDGLSDFDRVDQYWQREILPVIEGQRNIKEAVKTLVEIGNTKNGHDNVTVALVYCQVKPKDAKQSILSLSEIPLPTGSQSVAPTTQRLQNAATLPTQPSFREEKNKPWWLIGLIALVVISSLGVLAYFFFSKLPTTKQREINPTPTVTVTPTPTPQVSLQVGNFLKIKQEITLNPQSSNISENQNRIGIVPANTVLQVSKINPEQDQILLLKVCSLPAQQPAIQGALQEGDEGEISLAAIQEATLLDFTATEADKGKCQTATPKPTSTPTPVNTNTPSPSPSPAKTPPSGQ